MISIFIIIGFTEVEASEESFAPHYFSTLSEEEYVRYGWKDAKEELDKFHNITVMSEALEAIKNQLDIGTINFRKKVRSAKCMDPKLYEETESLVNEKVREYLAIYLSYPSLRKKINYIIDTTLESRSMAYRKLCD